VNVAGKVLMYEVFSYFWREADIVCVSLLRHQPSFVPVSLALYEM
jgi:hypothetical protein